MAQYDAVLFDFDGTILDTEWIIYETWRDLYRREGQELPLETYVQCIGSGFHVWSPETHLESLTSKTYDWQTLNAERQPIIRKGLESAGPMVGAREAFQAAKDQKITVGVVSSSSHNWVDTWLEKLGLISYCETIVCRGDVPEIKPAPDLYLKAAENLALAPAQCLVIEDSRNGMIAGQRAGMDVISVPNRVTQVSDFTGAEAVLNSLETLPSYF